MYTPFYLIIAAHYSAWYLPGKLLVPSTGVLRSNQVYSGVLYQAGIVPGTAEELNIISSLANRPSNDLTNNAYDTTGCS